MQYESVFKVIGCSCYTCLPRTAPAAAQTDLKTDAPGTGTGAPQMDQRLLTNTWPKQCTIISIQANTNQNQETVHQYIKTARKTKFQGVFCKNRGLKHN